MELVKAESYYWEFIRTLRNLNHNNGFVNNKQITIDEQKSYMDDNWMYYHVCILDNNPVGFIGVIENDIRLATSPEFIGQGIGSFMLNEIMEMYPYAQGKVKIENKESRKLFEKNGFKEKFVIYEKEEDDREEH